MSQSFGGSSVTTTSDPNTFNLAAARTGIEPASTGVTSQQPTQQLHEPFSFLVPSVGVEPTSSGLGNRRSVH